MGVLSEQWRKRAEELNAALEPLLKQVGVTAAQVQATKAAVLPELLLNLADMLDVLEAAPHTDAKIKKARAIAARNNHIRMAAATEDWDAIDRIINDAIDAAKSGDS